MEIDSRSSHAAQFVGHNYVCWKCGSGGASIHRGEADIYQRGLSSIASAHHFPPVFCGPTVWPTEQRSDICPKSTETTERTQQLKATPSHKTVETNKPNIRAPYPVAFACKVAGWVCNVQYCQQQCLLDAEEQSM